MRHQPSRRFSEEGMNELKEIRDSITYPATCGCALGNWIAFLVVALILSFLWSTVISRID